MASVGDKYQSMHCNAVLCRRLSEVIVISELLQAQWNFSQSANLTIDKLCPSSANLLSSHTASLRNVNRKKVKVKYNSNWINSSHWLHWILYLKLQQDLLFWLCTTVLSTYQRYQGIYSFLQITESTHLRVKLERTLHMSECAPTSLGQWTMSNILYLILP